MLLAALLALSLSPAAGQNRGAVDPWAQRHHQAVEAYRGGETTQALTLLGEMTAEEQKKAVETIRAQQSWTDNAVRALSSLHYEAALVALKIRERDEYKTAVHHLALGRTVLELLHSRTRVEEPPDRRWILAIALDLTSDAEFADAYRILQPHCDDADADAALLVACGTVDESFASSAGEQLMDMRTYVPGGGALVDAQYSRVDPAIRNLAITRDLRARWLESARKGFERALVRAPLDPEAQLRLAHVRLQQKQFDQSATLLEYLSPRSGLDPRTQYLAYLFLGRVRLRQERLDAAAAALSRLVPHQSALLARAQLAQQRGDSREAASLADRATRQQVEDPWWSYRYGQYWVADRLFAQLRAEARK